MRTCSQTRRSARRRARRLPVRSYISLQYAVISQEKLLPLSDEPNWEAATIGQLRSHPEEIGSRLLQAVSNGSITGEGRQGLTSIFS